VKAYLLVRVRVVVIPVAVAGAAVILSFLAASVEVAYTATS